MSKMTAAKEALDDHNDLTGLLEIMKNIATNRFYTKLAERIDKSEIDYVIRNFFKIAYTSEEAKSFFDYPSDAKTAILAITTDGGFMGTMTAKVINAVLQESKKRDVYEVIMFGKKGVEKLKPFRERIITSYVNVREDSYYRTAVAIKAHIMKLIQDGKIQRVVAIFPYAQTLNLVKHSVVELFPPSGLVKIDENEDSVDDEDTKKKEGVEKEATGPAVQQETVMFESSPIHILQSMSSIWLVFQISEMMAEAAIAGFATQSQQLENSMDAMTKEGKKLLMSFRKAKRAEIDKSLREAFSNTLISSAK